jgi:hypothetical protein
MARRKPQPFQTLWDGSGKTIEDLNRKLSTQFQRIDEMFRELYTTTAQVDEGTWTPVDQSGGGLVFADPTGAYIRLGNLIVATAYIKYPTTADTNAALISGLPFVVDTSTASVIQYGALPISSDESTLAHLIITTSGYLSPRTTANATITNATLSTNVIYLTVIYRTTN